MENGLMLTKFQVAESQLLTAIRLYFEDGDPVSVHTLISAANEILDILCKHNGLGEGAVSFGIKDVENVKVKKKILDAVNRSKNFFKHSTKNPDEVIEFKSRLNDYVIADTTILYKKFLKSKKVDLPREVVIYDIYFGLCNEDMFENGVFIKGIDVTDVREMVKSEKITKKELFNKLMGVELPKIN